MNRLNNFERKDNPINYKNHYRKKYEQRGRKKNNNFSRYNIQQAKKYEEIDDYNHRKSMFISNLKNKNMIKFSILKFMTFWKFLLSSNPKGVMCGFCNKKTIDGSTVLITSNYKQIFHYIIFCSEKCSNKYLTLKCINDELCCVCKKSYVLGKNISSKKLIFKKKINGPLLKFICCSKECLKECETWFSYNQNSNRRKNYNQLHNQPTSRFSYEKDDQMHLNENHFKNYYELLNENSDSSKSEEEEQDSENIKLCNINEKIDLSSLALDLHTNVNQEDFYKTFTELDKEFSIDLKSKNSEEEFCGDVINEEAFKSMKYNLAL